MASKPPKKRRQGLIYALIAIAILAGLGVVGYLLEHKPHKVITTTVHTAQVSKPVIKPKAAAAPTSYYVGDTQTDASLTVTPTRTYTLTQAQVPMPIPAGDILFGVDLTVTNNGTAPAIEQIGTGFTELSSVYTQIGSDTSTGKYILPDTGNESAGCFGNSTTVIAPEQTVSSCVQFLVPSNVLVDTFFYDNDKWYL